MRLGLGICCRGGDGGFFASTTSGFGVMGLGIELGYCSCCHGINEMFNVSV